MMGASARAAVWLAFPVFAACDAVSFESLGKLAASASGSAAPSVDAGSQDAGAPRPPIDAATMIVPPTLPAAGSDARDSGAAPSSSGGAGGMPAAAGSGGAAGAPGALGGVLGSMPFSMRDGYVAGLSEPGETTLYLFDSSVSCSQVSSFAWLSQLPSTTRVIELAFPSTGQTGSPVMNASISYMHGGTYAFSKMRASASMLVLSHVTQAGPIDGTLTATFGSETIEGAFHAEYCASGTGL